MADNYLENKMDAYRRGVNSAPRRVLTPSGTRAGHFDIPFPPRKVLVIGATTQAAREVLTQFAATGSKVAFCEVKAEWGADYARRGGLRFYPVADYSQPAVAKVMSDLTYRWHGLDVVVATDADAAAAAEAFAAARRANPLPTDYAGRLVILATAPFSLPTNIGDITTMRIDLTDANLTPTVAAQLALFFATPAGVFL